MRLGSYSFSRSRRNSKQLSANDIIKFFRLRLPLTGRPSPSGLYRHFRMKMTFSHDPQMVFWPFWRAVSVAAREHKRLDPIPSVVSGRHYVRITGWQKFPETFTYHATCLTPERRDVSPRFLQDPFYKCLGLSPRWGSPDTYDLRTQLWFSHGLKRQEVLRVLRKL
jgi:hypothetical protein